mgnify:CR=1 FL=1
MQLKHIYWFGYYNNSVPSIRYRALIPLHQLNSERNITFDFVYPSYRFKQIVHFIKIYFSVYFKRKPDSIIVFQKIYTNGIYARLLKFLLIKQPNCTLYDIDDAEYVRRPVETIHYLMQHCNCCTVGSKTLKSYAAKFNERVYLLTSPIAIHQQIKLKRNAVFTIGWIGYFGAHYESLRTYILPIITTLAFPVRIVILGITQYEHYNLLKSEFASNQHITLIAPLNINWFDETAIYKEIVQFDIGIAPLLDTEFNRAKSAYKMKQYLSCGIPVLASPVGENATFLQDGVNGFFCNSANDFYDKIVHMHNLSDFEYAKMSSAARAGLSEFSTDKYIDALIHVSENLLC